jgi:pimeloyl-ACP methyl ester carboxylesterase
MLAVVALALLLAACGDGSATSSSVPPAAATAATSPAPTSPASTQPSRPDLTEPDTAAPDTAAPTTARLTTTAPAAASRPVIEWQPCGPQRECGRLSVPLDHDRPDAGTISLAVVRRLADDPTRRIGSLLVNPGGPGFGGTVLVESAELVYSAELLERFDIVGWDPRGTGDSTPAVDCVDDYDPYFALDPSPDDRAERTALLRATNEFGARCAERSGDLLRYVSTEASARDMDLLRQALGEDEISYFGFSYGSELGATWVTLYPDTVRAAVLDGAVDPTADVLERARQQAAGFEAAFEDFLADCSARVDCPLQRHGDPAPVVDGLLERLDASPLPVDPTRTPVTPGVAATAIVNALYSDTSWPILADALSSAVDGDGAPLLALYDQYYQRRADGSYGDELEAYYATMCLDQGASAIGLDEELRRLAEVAPRLGSAWALELQVCAGWPVPPAGTVAVTGAGAGPVLVVGTTGDAATPLAGTRAMASALAEGRLVVVEADQHTGYGANPCIDEVVDRYLVDLVPPPEGAVCPPA